MKHHLDACRLLCPMPVIKVQEKMKTLAIDDILEVACTDPGALQDIPMWCRMYGHTVLENQEADGVITILLKKCS